MSKSVYSMVLTDEVVQEIDKLAYKNNTNRSNMINRILADYVSYTTPEMKINDIFRHVSAILGNGEIFKTAEPSDTMLSLNSHLTYKYNPSVRYSLELYRDASDAIGEIRVSMRTQNSALTMALIEFYKLWDKIECARLGTVESHIDSLGRYSRVIRPRMNSSVAVHDSATLGELIADYIRTFDLALKAFFYNLSVPSEAVREVEKIYSEYLRSSSQII